MIFEAQSFALTLEYMRALAVDKPAVVGLLPEGRSIYNQKTTTLCDTITYPDGSPICKMVGETGILVMAPKGGVDVDRFCQKVFPGLTTSGECVAALKGKLDEGDEPVTFTVENNLVSATWKGTTITGDGSMSPKAPLINFLQVLRQLKEAKVQEQQSTNSPLLVVVEVTAGGVIVLGLSFLALGKMSERGAKRVSEGQNNRYLRILKQEEDEEVLENYRDDKRAAEANVVYGMGFELWEQASYAKKHQLLNIHGSQEKAVVSLGRQKYVGLPTAEKNKKLRENGFFVKRTLETKIK